MSTASETPDGYQLIVRLGEGGFGEVWLAEHEPTGEWRALKWLWRIDDQAERDRFAQEAHLTRELGYLPYVVQVLEYGVDTPRPWIAYEYIEGDTLAGAAPVAHDDLYLRHAIELSAAVTAVHHGNIAHRDLKPTNVMIERTSGSIKLLDFGIALTGDFQITADPQRAPVTYQWAAPERFPTSGVAPLTGGDSRVPGAQAADVFSLGLVLTHLRTGANPFAGWQAIPEADTPADLSRLEQWLEPWLAELISPMVDRDPGDRPTARRALEQLRAENKRSGFADPLDPVEKPHLAGAGAGVDSGGEGEGANGDPGAEVEGGPEDGEGARSRRNLALVTALVTALAALAAVALVIDLDVADFPGADDSQLGDVADLAAVERGAAPTRAWKSKVEVAVAGDDGAWTRTAEIRDDGQVQVLMVWQAPEPANVQLQLPRQTVSPRDVTVSGYGADAVLGEAVGEELPRGVPSSSDAFEAESDEGEGAAVPERGFARFTLELDEDPAACGETVEVSALVADEPPMDDVSRDLARLEVACDDSPVDVWAFARPDSDGEWHDAAQLNVDEAARVAFTMRNDGDEPIEDVTAQVLTPERHAPAHAPTLRLSWPDRDEPVVTSVGVDGSLPDVALRTEPATARVDTEETSDALFRDGVEIGRLEPGEKRQVSGIVRSVASRKAVTTESRVAGDELWREETAAEPGDVLDQRVTVANRGNVALEELAVGASLDSGLELIEGSGELSVDGSTSAVPDDAIQFGASVGDVAVEDEAELRWQARMLDNATDNAVVFGWGQSRGACCAEGSQGRVEVVDDHDEPRARIRWPLTGRTPRIPLEPGDRTAVKIVPTGEEGESVHVGVELGERLDVDSTRSLQLDSDPHGSPTQVIDGTVEVDIGTTVWVPIESEPVGSDPSQEEVVATLDGERAARTTIPVTEPISPAVRGSPLAWRMAARPAGGSWLWPIGGGGDDFTHHLKAETGDEIEWDLRLVNVSRDPVRSVQVRLNVAEDHDVVDGSVDVQGSEALDINDVRWLRNEEWGAVGTLEPGEEVGVRWRTVVGACNGANFGWLRAAGVLKHHRVTVVDVAEC